MVDSSLLLVQVEDKFTIAIDERMFVCLRSGAGNTCAIDEASGIPADISDKNLFSIDWTRFGDVSIDKWSPGKEEWVLLQ